MIGQYDNEDIFYVYPNGYPTSGTRCTKYSEETNEIPWHGPARPDGKVLLPREMCE